VCALFLDAWSSHGFELFQGVCGPICLVQFDINNRILGPYLAVERRNFGGHGFSVRGAAAPIVKGSLCVSGLAINPRVGRSQALLLTRAPTTCVQSLRSCLAIGQKTLKCQEQGSDLPGVEAGARCRCRS
jgi:hypothetical protein